MATAAEPDRSGAKALLTEPKFELMPFESFGEQMGYLPDGATIAITTSPTLGIDATVEWTEKAAAAGFEIIPHIAARYIEDESHLAAIAERLLAAGVSDIFVPGGDRDEPVGEFTSAYDLLSTLADMEYSFADIGITGYPEGHAFLDDDTLASAMERKEPYATYIVTQLCYDPNAVLSWLRTIRARGISLPVDVGLPGVLRYQRLLQISRKVGVGDSIDFLRKTSGILEFIREFIGSRGKYTPDDIVEGLGPYVDDPEYGIRNVHIYTFNQVPDTEEWRRSYLA